MNDTAVPSRRQGAGEGTVPVSITINGESVSREVEPRMLLVNFIRDVLGLTGTHIGCDTSQCGACLIDCNGDSIKSCTMLAVQADGCDITTIEALANGERLHPIQEAFCEHHALQCGFCTPGMIIGARDLLRKNPNPSEAEVREWLDGNLCRCTGYNNIVKAILSAAAGGKRS